MKITIAIPIVSIVRLKYLLEEVKSIEAGTYKNICIVIVVDGNPKLYDKLRSRLPSLNGSIILNKERLGWVASINRVFKEFESEYYIYGSDDLVFPPNCIENAMVTMKEKFPDGYGVVTLGRRQKAIFGLVGNKWVEHFPKREVFCPFYTHYGADPEHTAFALAIKKFAFPKNRSSQVVHHRLNDKTRIFSRSSRFKDLTIWHKRQEQGRIWGVNFDR